MPATQPSLGQMRLAITKAGAEPRRSEPAWSARPGASTRGHLVDSLRKLGLIGVAGGQEGPYIDKES